VNDWGVARYVTAIDGERTRLRKMLRAKDAAILVRRPANGGWSIVEHVRHLLFAEQLHLGRFLPSGFEWSPKGLGGNAGRGLSEVGTEPTQNVESVFREWDEIHKSIRKAVKSLDTDVDRALWRNHRHLGIHIKLIEKLMRRWDA
jgi:hypothetical protein